MNRFNDLEPQHRTAMDDFSDVGALPPLDTLISGRFFANRRLADDGLGPLYWATDQESGKKVALRILGSKIANNPRSVEFLRALVARIGKIRHKNIARLYGIGKHNQHRFLVSEAVVGQPLAQIMRQKRERSELFSLRTTYNILAHTSNALHHVHRDDAGPPIIHGLPGTMAIVITKEGRLKLQHFGLVLAYPSLSAKIHQPTDRRALAPEFISSAGRIFADMGTPASDIYSLGCLAYSMLAGAPPSMSGYDPISGRVNGVPSAIDDVIRRAIDKDARRRFQSTRALKAAFYEAAGIDRGPDFSEPVTERTRPRSDTGGHSPTHALATPPLTTSDEHLVEQVQASPYASRRQPKGERTAAASSTPLTHRNPSVRRTGEHHPQEPSMIGASVEELLAQPMPGNQHERWLISKNGMDYGPYSGHDLKQRLYRGEFTIDDPLLDQHEGTRSTARQHPQLNVFSLAVERNLAQGAERAAAARVLKRQRTRKNIFLAIISMSILGTAAAVVFYLIGKERIIYKASPAVAQPPNAFDVGAIKISWNKEPGKQTRRGRRRRKARKKGYRSRRSGRLRDNENETYLGDVSAPGGDEVLTQAQIQQVMRRAMPRLSRCIVRAARQNKQLTNVTISFGVKGDGKISYVKVNQLADGAFHACIEKRMRTIRFPQYDGRLTRASFTVSLPRS